MKNLSSKETKSHLVDFHRLKRVSNGLREEMPAMGHLMAAQAEPPGRGITAGSPAE
jgi:hypothetical protein